MVLKQEPVSEPPTGPVETQGAGAPPQSLVGLVWEGPRVCFSMSPGVRLMFRSWDHTLRDIDLEKANLDELGCHKFNTFGEVRTWETHPPWRVPEGGVNMAGLTGSLHCDKLHPGKIWGSPIWLGVSWRVSRELSMSTRAFHTYPSLSDFSSCTSNFVDARSSLFHCVWKGFWFISISSTIGVLTKNRQFGSRGL